MYRLLPGSLFAFPDKSLIVIAYNQRPKTMNEHAFPSKAYFSKNPESIHIYNRITDPRTRYFKFDIDLTKHAADWFELYYDAASSYTPDLLPLEPYALTGISLCPYTNPADNSPILAVAGLYRYRHQPHDSIRVAHTNPIALGIETHGGEEEYLSYRNAFDTTDAPRPLSEDLSIDVATLMAGYYRRELSRRNSPKAL